MAEHPQKPGSHVDDGIPPPAEKFHRNVWTLGAASLMNDVASEMVFPLLPAFLLALPGGSKIVLGIFDGAAETVASLLKLFAGGWSDRLGARKTFILIGYSIAALSRPWIGVISAAWQAIPFRLLDRVGKGIRTAPRDALIADSSTPTMRGRAFGLHRAMDHLGAALGPLIAAGYLWYFPGGHRSLFFWTIFPGIFVVFLLSFSLREAPSLVERPTAPRSPMRLTLAAFDRRFVWLLVAIGLFTLGNSSDLFLLARARDLGVPDYQAPLLWFAFHVLKSLQNIVFGWAADRGSPRMLIGLGWLIYAGIYIAFALATEAWHAWVFFLAYSLFYGLSEPAEKLLIAQWAGESTKGLAFGWFHFITGLMAFPASLIFGIIYDVAGAEAAFGWSAALALAAIVVLFVSPRHASAEPTVGSTQEPRL